jgi:hypothetical protein
MSLTTNTIAYEGPRARGISVRGIGILVAGLVLGSVIGLAIATSSTTTDAPEASVTGMALDDFIRLNTTSLNGLAPVASAAVVESVSVDPGFLEINTTSFNGLAPVAASVVDPGFLEMNVGSFDGLTRVVSPQPVEPSFLEMNIGSLEYPAGGYTEPSSGIR